MKVNTSQHLKTKKWSYDSLYLGMDTIRGVVQMYITKRIQVRVDKWDHVMLNLFNNLGIPLARRDPIKHKVDTALHANGILKRES